MEETKSKDRTIKTALIGGFISIILSPIAIVVSYYLGSSLSSPKIDIKYVLANYEYQKNSDEVPIPINLVRPFQIDFELVDLMQKTQSPMDVALGSLVDDLRQNEVYYDDIRDIITLIDLSIDIINSKQELSNKEGRIKTLNEIKAFLTAKQNEKRGDGDKIRTGRLTLKIGMLNAGQTDDVVFPEGRLSFLDNEMVIKNIRKPGYTVVKPHSFEELSFTIDTIKSPAGTVSKWKTIIKDKSIIDYNILINTSSKNIASKARLEPE